MTKEQFFNNVYVGKHEMHYYKVSRKYSEADEWKTIYVTGKLALAEACINAFATRVVDLTLEKEFPFE